jgi:hypothetical protein
LGHRFIVPMDETRKFIFSPHFGQYPVPVAIGSPPPRVRPNVCAVLAVVAPNVHATAADR